MSFAIKGYVFEPPRVGTGNSPYTMTPNNVIWDTGAFAAVYPDGSEPNPRADYMAIVMQDGLLVNAAFGWTKNEVVARFDYDGGGQRFRTLPGGPLLVVGQVGPTLNITRLKVPVPTAVAPPVAAAPWRLSVGIDSGITLATVLVTAFGAPAIGTVEILTTTGELNWNATDLTTYVGQAIRFQRQAFFGFNESNGSIGLSGGVLLLNPLPATGQYPLVRLGFAPWLLPVERATEGAFSADPVAGTVEWAADTGRIKLNSAAIALGRPVYHDGVLMHGRIALPTTSVGTCTGPTSFPTPVPGGDLIFKLASGYQFPYLQYVTAFDPVGQAGVVQLLVAGPVTTLQFSLADRTAHGAASVTLVSGDLPIERGFSLRLFRTPINLTGQGTTKDVTSVYSVVGATFINPIIGAPDVFLPQAPRDDGTLVVRVQQGTGTFMPGTLPILDGSIALPVVPGPTYGYIIDYEAKRLKFAFRKNNQLLPFLQPTGAFVLPDPLVQTTGLTLDIETGPGTNIFVPLTLGTDAIFDGNATVTFAQTVGNQITSGTGSFVGTTLTDPQGSFAGIVAGDILVVQGGVYTITVVTDVHHMTTDLAAVSPGTVQYEVHHGRETLADRYFAPVELLDPSTSITRSMTPGPLKINRDYTISPVLGFINFTKRFLALEQATITYDSIDPTTGLPVPVVEPAVFLVRKELCQPHPVPTDTLHFNPLGRTIATSPAPAVSRGGRPQVIGVQCVVDTTTSTITFLPDAQLTDALPHGATVNPNENVYVDYYVTQAIGGEQSLTVQQPPMSIAHVQLAQDAQQFIVAGDQTSTFLPDYLLRIEQIEVHMIDTVVYDAVLNQTTVALKAGDAFQDQYADPKLYQTSGITRTASSGFYPNYFPSELAAYVQNPRGMNTLRLVGDRTSSYRQGTVVRFTDAGMTFQHLYLVTAVALNANGDTYLTFASTTRQQYTPGTHFLSYSLHPILEDGATLAVTSKVPLLTQPHQVFRRVEGHVGQLLTPTTDYTVDDSGVVTYRPPLVPSEDISIFYTGHVIEPAGVRLRASYTALTVPTSTNGLLNQILMADYGLDSSDTFYWRVETMTNFRAEMAQEIQASAQSSVPSGGPLTSNATGGALYTKGRPSLYFDEGHLANQDIVARRSLLWYNGAVNDLEDTLHAFDGRVVGDSDGRFRFDGLLNNPVRTSLATVTNQIDDQLVVSPFPLPGGTHQAIYIQGPYSRFFKTRRNLFTTSPALAGIQDDDVIAALPFKNLTSVPAVAFKRQPRAQIQHDYPVGANTFIVDNATGTNDAQQRPAFIVGMRVVIQDALGTFYINDAAAVTVLSVLSAPERLVLFGASALPIPAGATIYCSPSDANSMMYDGSDPPPVPSASGAYMMQYPFGKDINANFGTGELLYRKRAFPFDGTLPTTFIPKSLLVFPVQPGDILQCNGVGIANQDVAPYRFPALYGGTTNDDGDHTLPMVGPTFDGELTPAGGGPLNVELLAEQPVTGTLRTATTAPYLGTGSLDVTKTLITDTVPYVGTLPKVGDLVRILTGLNGATQFRRVALVGASSVTVDSAFTTQDAGFQYTIAVSATLVSGTATLAGTTLTDPLAFFLTHAQVGWTVVMTSGPNLMERRQIVSVDSSVQLTLDAAFSTPITIIGDTYRIDNPLDTYGGTGSILASVSTALATEIATISGLPTSENVSLLAFLLAAFTPHVTSAAGSVAGTTLTDLTQNFVTADVTSSHFVWVVSGVNEGIYPVASVDSPTQITTTLPFPSPAAGVPYEIVAVFGVGLQTLQDIIGIMQVNDVFLAATQAFQTLVNTPVPVLLAGVADPGAFARGIQTTDLNTRAAAVLARLTYLQDPGIGPIAKIQNVLLGTERLYDQRYTWIDARINRSTGYLVRRQRAIDSRLQAQVDVVNQLFKLLSVQGG